MDIQTLLRPRSGDEPGGAVLVEYALLLALIAIICIMAISNLGDQPSGQFQTVGTSMPAAGN